MTQCGSFEMTQCGALEMTQPEMASRRQDEDIPWQILPFLGLSGESLRGKVQ